MTPGIGHKHRRLRQQFDNALLPYLRRGDAGNIELADKAQAAIRLVLSDSTRPKFTRIPVVVSIINALSNVHAANKAVPHPVAFGTYKIERDELIQITHMEPGYDFLLWLYYIFPVAHHKNQVTKSKQQFDQLLQESGLSIRDVIPRPNPTPRRAQTPPPPPAPVVETRSPLPIPPPPPSIPKKKFANASTNTINAATANSSTNTSPWRGTSAATSTESFVTAESGTSPEPVPCQSCGAYTSARGLVHRVASIGPEKATYKDAATSIKIEGNLTKSPPWDSTFWCELSHSEKAVEIISIVTDHECRVAKDRMMLAEWNQELGRRLAEKQAEIDRLMNDTESLPSLLKAAQRDRDAAIDMFDEAEAERESLRMEREKMRIEKEAFETAKAIFNRDKKLHASVVDTLINGMTEYRHVAASEFSSSEANGHTAIVNGNDRNGGFVTANGAGSNGHSYSNRFSLIDYRDVVEEDDSD